MARKIVRKTSLYPPPMDGESPGNNDRQTLRGSFRIRMQIVVHLVCDLLSFRNAEIIHPLLG